MPKSPAGLHIARSHWKAGLSAGGLRHDRQVIGALAPWVDDGSIGDWHPEVGSEHLNHRTMLVQPPVGRATAPSVGWLEQLMVIARRFYYWLGLDD